MWSSPLLAVYVEAKSVLPTMTMKIQPYNDNEKDSLSLSAKVTSFLVTINMIPVSVNKHFTDATFSVFSFRTLVYLLVANSPGFSIGITWLLQPDFANEYFMKAAEFYVTFERIVIMFFYFLIFITNPLHLLFFGEAFCRIKEVSMSKSLAGLKSDKNGLFAGVVVLLGGLYLHYIGHYLTVAPSIEGFSSATILGYTIVSFCILMTFLFLLASPPFFLGVCWLNTIEENFQEKGNEDILSWAEYCIALYKKTEKVLGKIFLFEISLCQVCWVISLFMAISLAVGETKIGTMLLMMNSIGKITSIFKDSCSIFRVSLCLHWLFNSHQDIYFQDRFCIQKLQEY